MRIIRISKGRFIDFFFIYYVLEYIKMGCIFGIRYYNFIDFRRRVIRNFFRDINRVLVLGVFGFVFI